MEKKHVDLPRTPAADERETNRTASKKALLFGGSGLLGQALAQALKENGYQVTAPSHEDLDVRDARAVEECVLSCGPNQIYNAVAYTAVDRAEDDVENAMALNRALPQTLGRIARSSGIYLVHFSTDFVFNGKQNTPYDENCVPAPLSVYGKSKLEGEKAILALNPENFCIVRTAWLFGHGRKNFVRTILDRCALQGSVSVVHDQIGSPTYCVDLAHYSIALAEHKGHGIFHIANAGCASWCELAAEAVRISGCDCPVHPISHEEYATKATRPAYSVLCTKKFTEATGIIPRSWPLALADYLNLEYQNVQPH